ncbi:MAG TPA: hypothetical protein VG937_11595 [Polyangiaceae bacterium]|nr:hypothetical protein [Polyangiaceae bacterium]
MGRWVHLLALSAGLQSLSCGGKALDDKPRAEASGGASGASSTGGAASVEQHLLVAKAGVRASHPDATWSADRLAVAYLIESRDGRKGLGLSISRSESVARDGFAQFVLQEPSARYSPRIASVADGYAVAWLEAGQVPEALMLLAVDGEGQAKGDARKLAHVDAMQFSLASAGRTLAVAATERIDDAWTVTLRLVSDGVDPAPRVLDKCTQPSSLPALAWDGAAFDVVYVCADGAPAAPRMQLVRIAETGEILGAPRVLPAEPAATPCPSLGLSFDRGALTLLYASQTAPAAASFVRIDPDAETPFEPRSLQGTLPAGQFSIAATPKGYEVLSTGCPSQNLQGVAVISCTLDATGAPSSSCRRMPTSSSVPRASTLVPTPEDVLFVYDEYLLNSHATVFVVPLPTEPSAGFSPVSVVSPVGELSHGSLACAAGACRLQSFRGNGRFRSEPPRVLEYDELGNVEALSVDLSSARVDVRSDPRLLPVRTAHVVQSDVNGAFALLDPHAFEDPPSPSELVGLDRNLSELWSLPMHLGELFAEGDGVRGFGYNTPDDTLVKDGRIVENSQRNRRPVYELSFCAGAYYDIDAERRVIYRLEPRADAKWLAFATLPEGRGWLRCTAGMVCAETSDGVTRKWWCWDHAGKALPGLASADYDSRFFNRFEVSLGPDLGVGFVDTRAPTSIALTRLRPNGSTANYDLGVPSGLEFSQWRVTGDAASLHAAWNDANTGDTYLSTWELR